MTEAEDRTLVAAVIASGDRRAFGTLYDRHTPYLYRLALRLTAGDEPQAQDLVHDAWVAAAEGFARFEWASALRSWLAGIVVNCARRSARAEARLQRLDEARLMELDDAHWAGSEAELATYDRIELERAIAALPAGARHVFVLHDVEGWTHDAISRHLGIDAGTSKSQLSRARAALRARLDPPSGERER
jgi:RNA polymerase sigma factor (sigma-70 family)